MEDDVADHDRAVGRDLPGVRVGAGTVDDRDAPAADDLEHLVGPDDARGVLVDADAEQRRVLGDDGQQASESVALLEVLVDDDAGQDAEPGGHLGHALARRPAARPEGHHVAAHGARAGARAGHDSAVPMALQDGLGEPRAADRRAQAELVAAGQEDAGRIAHGGSAESSLACGRVAAWTGRTSWQPSSAKTRR